MASIFGITFGAPKPRPVSGGAYSAGFGLNNFPKANPVTVSGRVASLPSPSVGTVLAQSGTVPPHPLASYPLATPTVGASFGAAGGIPTSLGAVSVHGNTIGERH
jgi:hypothetical protein